APFLLKYNALLLKYIASEDTSFVGLYIYNTPMYLSFAVLYKHNDSLDTYNAPLFEYIAPEDVSFIILYVYNVVKDVSFAALNKHNDSLDIYIGPLYVYNESLSKCIGSE